MDISITGLDDAELLHKVVEQVSNALELLKLLETHHKQEAIELIEVLVDEARI